MKLPPFSIDRIHFTGIGGIGMSGIAEILHALGYQVQGSDLSKNANVERLEGLGIKVHIGQQASNIDGADVVVISSAVPDTNAEVQAAKAAHIPVVKRAEMLAELMRLKWTISVGGSHGKTSTTSLLSSVLSAAGSDPTIVSGGIINELGTNARLGSGEMMVVEADESDGSFQYLPSTMVIATNIDPEHMNYYGTLDHLKAAFVRFIEKIPFYGVGAMCGDDLNVQSILPELKNKRLVTYGIENHNHVQAKNIRMTDKGAVFDVEFHPPFKWSNVAKHSYIKDLQLSMFGQHNVLNALAVICIAQEIGVSEQAIRTAFSQFQGVKRRFTIAGHVNDVTFVDDYAHHPTEIKAVLDAAKSMQKSRVVVIMQPHRYSRLKDHYTEFLDVFDPALGADHVFVSPVYAAGEAPIEGYDSQTFVSDLLKKGVSAEYIDHEGDVTRSVASYANPGDLVIFMGAGTITKWAYEMPKMYEQLKSSV